MYVGHYMAWIGACLLYAVYLKSPEASAFLKELPCDSAHWPTTPLVGLELLP